MAINLGVRVELWTNRPDRGGEYLGAITREDLTAESAPAIGESFAPAGLGRNMSRLAFTNAGPLLPIVNVEHNLSGPAVSPDPPLVTAVARCHPIKLSAHVGEVLEDLRVDGWHINLAGGRPIPG